MTEHGKYIVIEGPSKIANVRQARMLVGYLAKRNIASQFVHEPCGLSSPNPAFRPHAKAELLQLTGHRMEIFDEKIEPGLTAGEIVVADGNWLSSLARQGVIKNLGTAVVRTATQAWLPNKYLNPDYLVMLSGHETADQDLRSGYDAIGPLAAPKQKANEAFIPNFSYISAGGTDKETHRLILDKLHRAVVI